jgi:nicotinamide riboside transporter PnuC
MMPVGRTVPGMESLWKYYGVDWLGITFSMLSTYYLGKKRKRGFLIGMGGNLAFMAFGVLASSAANVVANGIYFFLNARGWWKWKEEPPLASEAQEATQQRALAESKLKPKPAG